MWNQRIGLSFPRRVPASPVLASLPRACTVYGECNDHKVRISPCSHRCTATKIHTTKQDGPEGVLILNTLNILNILKASRTEGTYRPRNKCCSNSSGTCAVPLLLYCTMHQVLRIHRNSAVFLSFQPSSCCSASHMSEQAPRTHPVCSYREAVRKNDISHVRIAYLRWQLPPPSLCRRFGRFYLMASIFFFLFASKN